MRWDSRPFTAQSGYAIQHQTSRTAQRQHARETEAVMAEKVGFIGLGTIGNPMPRNVLKAGFPSVVYDVNPAAIDSGSAGSESERYQAV